VAQALFETAEQRSFDLDRVRLRFRDPAAEAQFERESLAQSINFIRAYVIAGTGLYALFGILDTITGGKELWELLTIRFGIVMPTLLGVFIFTFFPAFLRHAQAALITATLTAGMSIIVMTAIMSEPFKDAYYAGLIMVVIYCGTLIRLKFIHSLWISIFLFAAYQLVCWWINPITVDKAISNDFFLFMATGVGLFSGYIEETYIRKAYASQKVIEGKNDLLSVLLQESQKANRSKSEFLATISHELRTPLNAVIGFSEILKKQMFGPLGNVKYTDYVDDIHRSGSHLLSIINDILDLAKAESGRLELDEREVDVAEIMQRCMRMCHERAHSGRVRLYPSQNLGPVLVRADERLLFQVVLNLVSNAIKFTPEGGEVRLSVAANADEGVVLKVSDTGIGIAPEDIARVLRPFEQVESSLTRRHGGTGLGLPYAMRLAELHNGKLTIESALGKGTTATIWLPPERFIGFGQDTVLKAAV
jgi:two-component system cell cycle sensor histidine kinase PleC